MLEAVCFPQDEVPDGDFLWELIYPRGKDNEAIVNPTGRYVVRLFIMVRFSVMSLDALHPSDVAFQSRTAKPSHHARCRTRSAVQ